MSPSFAQSPAVEQQTIHFRAFASYSHLKHMDGRNKQPLKHQISDGPSNDPVGFVTTFISSGDGFINAKGRRRHVPGVDSYDIFATKVWLAIFAAIEASCSSQVPSSHG